MFAREFACCIATIVCILKGSIIRKFSMLVKVSHTTLHCLSVVSVDYRTIDDVVCLIDDQELLALAALTFELVFATNVGTFGQKYSGLALLVLTRGRSVSLLALKHVDLNKFIDNLERLCLFFLARVDIGMIASSHTVTVTIGLATAGLQNGDTLCHVQLPCR